jgi:hypothetical protein
LRARFCSSAIRRITAPAEDAFVGAGVLAWSGKLTLSGLIGPLAIAAACVAWASPADPLQIVKLKGLIGGGALPSFSKTLIVGVVGFLGYGVSNRWP